MVGLRARVRVCVYAAESFVAAVRETSFHIRRHKRRLIRSLEGTPSAGQNNGLYACMCVQAARFACGGCDVNARKSPKVSTCCACVSAIVLYAQQRCAAAACRLNKPNGFVYVYTIVCVCENVCVCRRLPT